jgi:hypothetical protein
MLVRSAFGSSFRSHDWLHAVEGVYVVLTPRQSLVAFAGVVVRTLHHNGTPFDAVYVERVAVGADQQSRGPTWRNDSGSIWFDTNLWVPSLGKYIAAQDSSKGFSPSTTIGATVCGERSVQRHDPCDMCHFYDCRLRRVPPTKGLAGENKECA